MLDQANHNHWVEILIIDITLLRTYLQKVAEQLPFGVLSCGIQMMSKALVKFKTKF